MDPEKWSLGDAIKAAGGAAFALFGREVIKRRWATKKEDYDQAGLIIRELRRINGELYATITALQKNHMAAIEVCDLRASRLQEIIDELSKENFALRYQAAKHGWTPEQEHHIE